MPKADLLKLEPIIKDNRAFMEITFSKAAKWTPEELLKEEVPVEDFLAFAEMVFANKANKSTPITPEETPIKPEFKKTTTKLSYKDYYIQFTPKDMVLVCEEQLIKLLTLNII